MSSMARGSYNTSPPVGKSGASSVSLMRTSGFFKKAIVVSQTSPKLKPHSWLAMPTAMPWLAETKIFGNVVGSSAGSFIELS